MSDSKNIMKDHVGLLGTFTTFFSAALSWVPSIDAVGHLIATYIAIVVGILTAVYYVKQIRKS